MLYRTCPSCGSNNDVGERCDCLGAQPSAATQIRTTAHNDAYTEEYRKIYADMRLKKKLPSCIADDIASTAAEKKAATVANATAKSYRNIKQGVRK